MVVIEYMRYTYTYMFAYSLCLVDLQGEGGPLGRRGVMWRGLIDIGLTPLHRQQDRH